MGGKDEEKVNLKTTREQMSYKSRIMNDGVGILFKKNRDRDYFLLD